MRNRLRASIRFLLYFEPESHLFYAVVLDCAVSNISVDHSDGRDGGVRPLPSGVMYLPSSGHEQVEWNQDMENDSLRLVNHGKVNALPDDDIFAANMVSHRLRRLLSM